MNTLIESVSEPLLSRPRDLRLRPAAPTLWRVVDRTGRVIGHVQAVLEDAQIRYRAKRFQPLSRSFRSLGDFWSADEAVECLRFER